MLLWAGLKPTSTFPCIHFLKSSALCLLQVKPSLAGQHPRIPFQHCLWCYVRHHLLVHFLFSQPDWRTVPQYICQGVFFSKDFVLSGFNALQPSSNTDFHGIKIDILHFIGYCTTGVCLRDPFPFFPAPSQQHSLLQQRPQTQPKSNTRDPKNLLC